jgi:uncharacterized protein YcnI
VIAQTTPAVPIVFVAISESTSTLSPEGLKTMTRLLARACVGVSLTLLTASLASAHITIAPTQSMAGATEKYTLRVPTEGTVATVAAEVDIPEGVIVEVVAMPNGWKHELKRQGDRITGIVWTLNIPPGEFVEFSFVARNPRDKAEVVWQLRQRFADGTVSDWTKGPNGVRSTSMTRLTPRPAQ